LNISQFRHNGSSELNTQLWQINCSELNQTIGGCYELNPQINKFEEKSNVLCSRL